jgi:hypothetical protein
MLNARLWQRSRWQYPILACAVGAVLGAALLVVVRTEVTSLRYDLGRLHATEVELEDEVQKLGVVAAALRAPERIAPRAQKLGMTYPEPGQVLSLPMARRGAGPVTGGGSLPLPMPDVAAGSAP